MDQPDFNLLVTLDAVLTEGSVAGAARRLNLSASAMSRALARLRETTSDPLLVRAGRGLVPTPRALELREPVHRLVEEALAALRPAAPLDLSTLARTFTLRTREGFVENFGAVLVARVAAEAPGVRLHFMPKADRETTLLRDGTVDLETGIVGAEADPEVRTRALFQDRFIGVVRAGHPLARGRMTLARYLAASHVLVARQGGRQSPVDVALQGAERSIAATTGSFAAALALARASDMVATVPARQTGVLREGMHSFDLPIEVPPLTVSMLWHPRMDADQAHRWLRGLVLETCA
ncbi:LysR family transcriptional regulator [Massilia sp. G4R7]|uniref:LysR family transcriptional regulator n=1 Tax=Massilia phyllostachyos TaxID=2898585 RepID=A0ABS8Q1C3_9BURK|nr:LysR family transcriptional regulator [Massilia phyllostachyos]MCD2515328.1 LysR family transcriptional regulator [Massilia phyllostachyos]